MQTFSVSKDTVFYKDNIQQRLLKSFGENWQTEEVKSGKVRDITTDELLEGFMDKSITFPHSENADVSKHKIQQSASLSELDLETQIKLRNRKNFLDTHIRFNQFQFTIKNIEESLSRFWLPEYGTKPCSKSVLKWAMDYVTNGQDILSLKSADHLKGNRTPRISPIITKIFQEVIESKYLTKERMGKKTAYAFAAAEVGKLNENLAKEFQYKVPSQNYFNDLINKRSAYEICLRREGKERARVKFRNAVHSLDPQFPLHIVLIDHTKIDLEFVAENRMPLGRAWLTLVTDLYTKSILGFHITFDHPSQHSVASALLHAILPKSALSIEYPETKGKFPMCGIPMIVIVDNGIEFHSAHFEDLCFRLGITIWYTPRKTPWFKANIEVTIGVICRLLLDPIPGKTFNSIHNKGDYDPRKEARVPLKNFKKALLKSIVDVYHETIHTTTGVPPRVLWEKSKELIDLRLPVDVESLDLLIMESEDRRTQHYGIDHNDMQYNNTALGDLQKIYGTKMKVKIRWNKYDLGYIYVESPEGEYIKVEATSMYLQYATGLTLHQHQIHKKYLRENKHELSSTNLAMALVECYRIMVSETTYKPKKNNLKKHKYEDGHPLSESLLPSVQPVLNRNVLSVYDDDDEIPNF